MALQLLLNLGFRGNSALELRGREVFTLRQIADRASKQLGSSLPVERTPREADIESLVAHGASYDFAPS